MIILETFDIAFDSMWRNKLRSILTMLGIIIGVASVILLTSIGNGLKTYVSGQFESLGANLIFVAPGQVGRGKGGPPVTRFTLGPKQLNDLKHIGYPIKRISPGLETYAVAKYRDKEEYPSVIAVQHSGLEILNYKAEKGRRFTSLEVGRSEKVAFLGPDIAEKLFKNVNPIGKKFFLQSTQYKVVGVFKSKGGGGGLGANMDESIVIPITTAQKQFNQDKFTAIYIQAANKDVIPDVKKIVDKTLSKTLEKDDYTIMGQEDLLKTINQILGAITAGLGGIAAISLLVGGIGIMNIMFITVTERTKEIGLRKALGATPKDILIQFLTESVAVSIIGGSIGIMIAIIGSIILSKFFASEVTLFAILLAFGFSSLVGIIFGVIPAYKAAKMDPIKALRYE